MKIILASFVAFILLLPGVSLAQNNPCSASTTVASLQSCLQDQINTLKAADVANKAKIAALEAKQREWHDVATAYACAWNGIIRTELVKFLTGNLAKMYPTTQAQCDATTLVSIWPARL